MRYLGEGLVAGLVFGVSDWLAAGVTRTPPGIVLVVLGAGLLGGLVAGGVGALLRRRGVALGLVVLVGAVLCDASILSKDVDPLIAGGWLAVIVVALLALILVTAALVTLRFALERGSGWTWPALVIASIPGTSLLWWVFHREPLMFCVASVLPFAVALLWCFLPGIGKRAELLALALAVVLLSLPTTLLDRDPRLRHEPAPTDARAPEDAPDVLLVIVDALRNDHAFDAPEGVTESTFARVAREGVRFDQAIAASSWTLPSVSSMLTSLHPARHGAVTRRRPLPPGATTLAEVFHEAGYETAAFTGGAFLSPGFGLDQGFEVFDHEAEERVLPFRVYVPLAWRLVKNRYVPLRFVLRRVDEYGGMSSLRGRVRDWIASRDRSRPFFLLVHTYQVHDYHIYQPEPDDPLLAGDVEPPGDVGNRLTIHPDELQGFSQEEIDWLHTVYRGRVAFVDREIGELLAEVEAETARDGLVTVLTSDHGEGFDVDRGRVHHGRRLHDDLLRVPFVLRAPGRLEAGRVVEELVRGIDLMPTVLELAGIPAPRGLDGVSLLPPLREEGKWPAAAWSQHHVGEFPLLSLRTARWKIVSTARGELRYRIDLDPFEDHPVPDGLPGWLSERWERRREYLVPRSVAGGDVGGSVRYRLDALGY